MAAPGGTVIELVDGDGSCYYLAGVGAQRIAFTRSFKEAKRFAADELHDGLDTAYQLCSFTDGDLLVLLHEHV